MHEVVAYAEAAGVTLGFEPEPGMLVETVADALRLREELGSPDALGITVDLGHCVAVEPDGVVGALRAAGDLLVNVQVDDMLPGVHEHLELGSGRLDLTAALTHAARDRLPRRGGGRAAPPLTRRAGRRRTQHACAPRGLGGTMSNPWTTTAVADITAEPQRIVVLFPSAGRAVGRTRSIRRAIPSGS